MRECVRAVVGVAVSRLKGFWRISLHAVWVPDARTHAPIFAQLRALTPELCLAPRAPTQRLKEAAPNKFRVMYGGINIDTAQTGGGDDGAMLLMCLTSVVVRYMHDMYLDVCVESECDARTENII